MDQEAGEIRPQLFVAYAMLLSPWPPWLPALTQRPNLLPFPGFGGLWTPVSGPLSSRHRIMWAPVSGHRDPVCHFWSSC